MILIITALLLIACTPLLHAIAHQRRYSVKYGELRSGLVSNVILGLLILVVILAIVNMSSVTEAFVTDSGIGIGLLVLAVLLLGYLIAESILVKGSFDERTISYSTPWRKPQSGQWSELKSARLSSLTGRYILKFADGTVIRISKSVEGHGWLLDFLARRNVIVR